MSKTIGSSRCNFIKKSTMGIINGGIMNRMGFSHTKQDAFGTDLPRVKEYRSLGRTGFKVSDLGAGYCESACPYGVPV